MGGCHNAAKTQATLNRTNARQQQAPSLGPGTSVTKKKKNQKHRIPVPGSNPAKEDSGNWIVPELIKGVRNILPQDARPRN